jgi:hypothetical protein
MNGCKGSMKVHEGEMIGRRGKEGIPRANKRMKRPKEWT